MGMESRGKLTHWGDFLVLAVYFGLVLSVGTWSVWRSKRATVKGYFLAGGSMSWLPVGASVFVSNIGSEHFVGLAGTGAASGVAIVLYEWLALILLVILGWLFLPVYMSAGVYTMPEYLQKRFGGQRIRLYLSCLSVILYIVAKLAVSIFSGALFIQLSTGWDMYLSIAVLLLVTAIFTILGGLTVVIYTDTIQSFIMVIGAFVLTGVGLHEVGGYDNLKQLYMNATPSIRDYNSSCGQPREDAFNVIRDPINSDNPFPGVFIFYMFGCMWYWCCDQVIVQRTLAAKSLQDAKAGCIFAGYLKVLPMYIMILPGMISRALYPDEVACIDPDECMKYCGNPVGCSNIAYPKLVLELLPVGARGLLMAVMMSAIMSSLTSVLNSSSTLFTLDIWPKIRKSASQRELLIAGRIFIVILAALSILWIPLVKTRQSGQLFVYIIVVQSYLATPIGPIFLIATLWKRMTEPAAFWALVIGQVVGVIRMILDFSYATPMCGEPETRPDVLYKVHYTYFGIISVVITFISVAVISLFTTPMENVDGLTWQTRCKGGYEIETEMNQVQNTSQRPAKQNCMLGDDDEIIEDVEKSGSSRKLVSWLSRLCGVPERSHVYKERDIVRKEVFFNENPNIKTFLDSAAILGILIVVFLIGYYH